MRAEVSDVAEELGRPLASVTSDEEAQWLRWIARVERTIEAGFAARGTSLIAAITAGSVSWETILDIETAAVARKVRNPDGSTSTTISIDDSSVTRRHDVGERVGDDPLNLTTDEWLLLMPVPLRYRPKAFSVGPR